MMERMWIMRMVSPWPVLIASVAFASGACSTQTTPASVGSPPAAPIATLRATPVLTPEPSLVQPSPLVAASIAPEPALKMLWESTDPTRNGGWVWTPTVDPEGRIWAASSFDHVFWIFDRDGRHLESWGRPGRGEGEFHFEAEGNGFGSVAFRPDGGFYVADAGNARVQQFDPDRKFIREWGGFGTGDGEFVSPLDIALDVAGHVYVLSDTRHDIQEFDADGTFIRRVATGVGPYLAVESDGDVYATDSSGKRLLRHKPSGEVDLVVDLSPIATFVSKMALAPSGDLFIATTTLGSHSPEPENLIQLDPALGVVRVWPNGAEGIAIDSAGDRIYATYSNLFPVVRAFALPGA